MHTCAKCDRHLCNMQPSPVQDAIFTSARCDRHQCKKRPLPVQDSIVISARCDSHQCKIRSSPIQDATITSARIEGQPTVHVLSTIMKNVYLSNINSVSLPLIGRLTELNLQIYIFFIINDICVK